MNDNPRKGVSRLSAAFFVLKKIKKLFQTLQKLQGLADTMQPSKAKGVRE